MSKFLRWFSLLMVITGPSTSYAQVDWSEMFPEEAPPLGKTPTRDRLEAAAEATPTAAPPDDLQPADELVVPIVPTPLPASPNIFGAVPARDPFVGKGMPAWKPRQSSKPARQVGRGTMRRNGASWDKIEQPW